VPSSKSEPQGDALRQPGKLIDARPAIVLERSRVGDWEGDLILGARSQSAIGTLVDRRSGFVRLVHLPHGYNSEQCRLAISCAIDDLPEQARLTLTWDTQHRPAAVSIKLATRDERSGLRPRT
jgi:IS30 family transposase